ncbi:metallophosphoesterase [Roseibium sp.]|uniref:metallophosphoesterase n=1 Tax=Roseibium sp. TaxID=1936156 RepID=UPI003B528D2C
MKLIHLTDLHIAPDDKGTAYEGAAERAARAVDIINADHADAELCVVTGDIVYDPDPIAYELAEQILSKLQVPVVSLVGNHDDRDMAVNTLSSLTLDRDGFAQCVVKTSGATCILLDTKAEGTHAGAFCKIRQDWLKAALNEINGSEPVWIFLHHAPFPTGLPAMDTIGLNLEDATALGDLLAAHGGAEHLFFGHYHRPMSGRWRNIAFSAHRSLMLQCALDLKTQEHVPAVPEEPQFGIVLAQPDLTVVHYHDFDRDPPDLTLGAADS